MALAATATVDASAHCVRFTITGGTAPYTVTAYPATAPEYRVRTMFTTVGATTYGVDGDVPLNAVTTYVIRDSAGAAVTTQYVEVRSTVPLLSDALNPTSVVPVVVVSQPPSEWEPRTVWWDILGARAPFVSVAPLRYRNGDLVLRCEDRAERQAVLAVLGTGAPFVLRAVCTDAVDDVVAVPNGPIREDLIRADQPAGPRLLTIPYQVVARELGPYAGAAGRTYAVALAESATYAVQSAGFATYATLLSGVRLP